MRGHLHKGELKGLKNKVKNKTNFLKICVQIIDYLDGGNYLVKIKGNYNCYNLKNNEIYCVNNTLLKKCDVDIWNNYLRLIKTESVMLNSDVCECDLLSQDSEKDNSRVELEHNELNLDDINFNIIHKRNRFNSY